MTDISTIVTQIMSLVLILTIITNIVVQVIKGVVPKSFATNLLVLIVAFMVTGAAALLMIDKYSITLHAWLIISIFGIGLLVAFASMYGFDKLKEMLKQIEEGKALSAASDLDKVLNSYENKEELVALLKKYVDENGGNTNAGP